MAKKPSVQEVRRTYGLIMILVGVVTFLFTKYAGLFVLIGFGIGLVSSSFQ